MFLDIKRAIDKFLAWKLFISIYISRNKKGTLSNIDIYICIYIYMEEYTIYVIYDRPKATRSHNEIHGCC